MLTAYLKPIILNPQLYTSFFILLKSKNLMGSSSLGNSNFPMRIRNRLANIAELGTETIMNPPFLRHDEPLLKRILGRIDAQEAWS